MDAGGSWEPGAVNSSVLLFIGIAWGRGGTKNIGGAPTEVPCTTEIKPRIRNKRLKKQEYHNGQETQNTQPYVWWGVACYVAEVWLASLRLLGVYLMMGGVLVLSFPGAYAQRGGCGLAWQTRGSFQKAGSSMIPTHFVLIFRETHDFRFQKTGSA